MRKHFLNFLYCCLLLCSPAAALLAASADDADPAVAGKPLNVVMISSYGPQFPSMQQLQAGLAQVLDLSDSNHQVFYEFLDTARISYDDNIEHFAEYLGSKYQHVDVDYVIAWSSLAAQFLLIHPELFPENRKIFIEVYEALVNSDLGKSIQASQIALSPNYMSINLAEFQRLAEPQHLYVVVDTSDQSASNRMENFARAMDQLMPGVSYDVLQDKSLTELQSVLEAAEPGSAVIYMLMYSDGEGRPMTPYAVAERISSFSAVPVFSFWESLMGSGIVGGRMYSQRQAGIALGELMEEGENLSLVNEISALSSVYDQAAMEKWQLDMDLVPEQAQIMNYRNSFVFEYRYQIAALGLFIMLLLSLTIGLSKALLERDEAMVLLQDERNTLTEKIAYHTRALYQMNLDLTKKNDELKKSISEVRALKGIVPICSSCKKVRDDEGFWKMVEEFVSSQGNTKFSQSICPHCMKHDFPEDEDFSI